MLLQKLFLPEPNINSFQFVYSNKVISPVTYQMPWSLFWLGHIRNDSNTKLNIAFTHASNNASQQEHGEWLCKDPHGRRYQVTNLSSMSSVFFFLGHIDILTMVNNKTRRRPIRSLARPMMGETKNWSNENIDPSNPPNSTVSHLSPRSFFDAVIQSL